MTTKTGPHHRATTAEDLRSLMGSDYAWGVAILRFLLEQAELADLSADMVIARMASASGDAVIQAQVVDQREARAQRSAPGRFDTDDERERFDVQR
jgi:hypothetical protein